MQQSNAEQIRCNFKCKLFWCCLASAPEPAAQLVKQRVVEFLGIADVWPGVVADGGDGAGSGGYLDKTVSGRTRRISKARRGALRVARRRDTRTDWREDFRGKTAKAPEYRRRAADAAPRPCLVNALESLDVQAQ